MKVRIALKADIPALVDFLNKVWKQMALPYVATVEGYSSFGLDTKAKGTRIAILEDGGQILALLGSAPVETDQGPGFVINRVVVDQDRPDKIDLLDRLCLWSGKLAALEGRPIILSADAKKEYAYGRDALGMEAVDHGVNMETGKTERVRLTAHVKDIVKAILLRHPDWT